MYVVVPLGKLGGCGLWVEFTVAHSIRLGSGEFVISTVLPIFL